MIAGRDGHASNEASADRHAVKSPVECDKCGACCRSFPVRVSLSDAEHEPRIHDCGLVIPAWLRSADQHYQLHPLPFLGSCTFLGNENLCRIYATRPDVCRRFEPGSIQCQEARNRLGLAPL